MTEKDMDFQLRKVLADIEKTRAETAKIQAEARFYPWIIGFGVVTALGTLATIAGKIL